MIGISPHGSDDPYWLPKTKYEFLEKRSDMHLHFVIFYRIILFIALLIQNLGKTRVNFSLYSQKRVSEILTAQLAGRGPLLYPGLRVKALQGRRRHLRRADLAFRHHPAFVRGVVWVSGPRSAALRDRHEVEEASSHLVGPFGGGPALRTKLLRRCLGEQDGNPGKSPL